ncbi:MAG: Bug family tripartite tricarboxylate transporter substrate binding protein [Hydrogenophaga sp.]|jgi:tripartite-type tricarboxylate transporter receptor subunit TctC|uniref:Bug family tripartite tricarboxylate transporter substrate binding protein n=1 Tax=Hydrogenophaga sp. TaxID=1904254 RepID=UPI0040365DEE
MKSPRLGRRGLLAALCSGLLATFSTGIAHAQAADWPRQPIKLLLGFTPGGGVDATARLVAQQLAEALGSPVVVENRPGAGGTLAANAVAKAEPDGHTLFLMASGHSISPALYKSLPYDSVNDFTMVTMTTRFPFGVAVGASSPIRNMGELMKQAKDKPGTLSMGHAGVGTGMHLASVLLQSREHVKFIDVAYKGGNLAPTAVAGGEIQAVLDNLASMEPLVNGNRLRLLAVTGTQRWPTYPDVPTLAETVSPGFDVTGWTALAGPRNLPAPVVARLSREMTRIMAKPEVIERLRKLGLGATSTEPAEAQKVLATEVARWQKLVQDEKIETQN